MSIFLAYFRDSEKRNLEIRDPWFSSLVREPWQRPPPVQPSILYSFGKISETERHLLNLEILMEE